MKHIKNYKKYEGKLNEEFGGLEFLGLTIGAMTVVPALVNYAAGAWQKFLMEKKYIPTGKIEKVVLTGGGEQLFDKEEDGKRYVEFEELKDKSSGEIFYGIHFSQSAGASDENRDVLYLVYNKENFEKVKKELGSGKGGEALLQNKRTATWSKTPSEN